MNGKLLVEAGVEYFEGVKKFMNRTDVYERLLKNFIKENSFEEAKNAIEQKDYETVLKSIHGMKSVTGTLCMPFLYEKCCSVVDNIRANQLVQAESDFALAYDSYTKIISTIQKA
ncbi:MAG: Hpt domain-containing protein [Hominimerdicola sp.]